MNINWIIFNQPTQYADIALYMQKIQSDIIVGVCRETVMLLEHEHVITKGMSAKSSDLLSPSIPVIDTTRGGKYTYHGPGQRICYLMMDLKKIKMNVHEFVNAIEEIIILTLRDLCVSAFRKDGMIGVWVCDKGQDFKIAAVGVSIKKFISSHGFSININPDMKFFSEIIPCGIKDFGVTSLEKLGVKVEVQVLDQLIEKNFYKVFVI